jgi:predicted anti-sigma-YlaC factor YlaD
MAVRQPVVAASQSAFSHGMNSGGNSGKSGQKAKQGGLIALNNSTAWTIAKPAMPSRRALNPATAAGLDQLGAGDSTGAGPHR